MNVNKGKITKPAKKPITKDAFKPKPNIAPPKPSVVKTSNEKLKNQKPEVKSKEPKKESKAAEKKEDGRKQTKSKLINFRTQTFGENYYGPEPLELRDDEIGKYEVICAITPEGEFYYKAKISNDFVIFDDNMSDYDSEKEKQKKQDKNKKDSKTPKREQEKFIFHEEAVRQMDKYKMAGDLKELYQNPSDFISRLLQLERPDLFKEGFTLEPQEAESLDTYLKIRGDVRTEDILPLKENETGNRYCDSLGILTKYDEGRFGVVYLAHKMNHISLLSGKEKLSMVKTSLRQSAASVSRMKKEITMLKFLFEDEKNVAESKKRIVPLLFDCHVLGMPFFVMPLMDASLQKIREEVGDKLTIPCAFAISIEILLAIKDVHSRKIVHRDIKPTNVLCHPTVRTQWMLIDFADAVKDGVDELLSPPDGLTLPFLPLIGHLSAVENTSAILKQDIESWFYILLDMIKPLPWKPLKEENEVFNAKIEFWNDYSQVLSDHPPQVLKIAEKIAGDSEYPYNDISTLLTEGFTSLKTDKWKPSWIEKRTSSLPVIIMK